MSRSSVDLTRAVQAVLLLIVALFPQFADVQDEAEAAVLALNVFTVGLLELYKRANVTPVADPRNDAGARLVAAKPRRAARRAAAVLPPPVRRDARGQFVGRNPVVEQPPADPAEPGA